MAKARILVVDDYPGARYRRMRILLDDGGFEVTEEMLGREAVRRAALEPIDLVLLDLHLPDISGLDVCAALKKDPRTKDKPVLLISAISEVEEASRLAEQYGAAGFVPDSADAATLVASIRAALQIR
jgi:adenylate cyclase